MLDGSKTKTPRHFAGMTPALSISKNDSDQGSGFRVSPPTTKAFLLDVADNLRDLVAKTESKHERVNLLALLAAASGRVDDFDQACRAHVTYYGRCGVGTNPIEDILEELTHSLSLLVRAGLTCKQPSRAFNIVWSQRGMFRHAKKDNAFQRLILDIIITVRSQNNSLVA